MAAVTKTFKDGAGADFTKAIQDALGPQSAAESLSVALANENSSQLTDIKAGIDALLVIAEDNTTDSPVIVHSPANVVSFAPVLDTSGAYSVGDVLFATAPLALMRANDLCAILSSFVAIDKTKSHVAFTLYFFQTNVTSAAANAANALTDADAISCLGFVDVTAADWKDLNNNSFACFKGINLMLEAAAGTNNIYAVAVITAGTPTFAANDLMFKLGVLQA